MSHENPASQTLFAVDPTTSGPTAEAYRFTTAQDAGLREGWFRDSIARNPELVIAACRRASLTDETWFHWGTEVGVTADNGQSIGSVDVLLVSETGRVGIVETKLSYNPERRRSVVAQVLDYALNLQGQDLDDVGRDLPSLDGRPLADGDAVQQRLQDGDFLLIVAGDVLDPRAVRLGQSMLGKHSMQSWDLAMVDLALYKRVGEGPGPACLMVPTLRGTLLAETRQVFKISIEGLPEGVRSTVTPVEPEPARPGRGKWNRTSFTAALETAALPPGFKSLGRRLLQLADEHPQLSSKFGTSREGSLVIKRQGYGLLEFFLSGFLRCRPGAIERGLPSSVAGDYIAKLKQIMGTTPSQEVYPYAAAAEVAPKAEEIVAVLESSVAAADRHEAGRQSP